MKYIRSSEIDRFRQQNQKKQDFDDVDVDEEEDIHSHFEKTAGKLKVAKLTKVIISRTQQTYNHSSNISLSTVILIIVKCDYYDAIM